MCLYLIIQIVIFQMINPKNMLNKVTMIQSQCEAKKTPLIANNFYRSPLRDRQNKINLSNTPLRTTGKVSLSPLRSRRTQVSTMSVKSTFSKKKGSNEQQCRNHSEKIAKFFVQSQDQKIYYCQKCAILLASQGFQVVRLNQMNVSQANSRKMQIQNFISTLQSLMKSFKNQYSQVDSILMKGYSQLQDEILKIQDYYLQFIELIDEHKKKVIEQLKEQFKSNNSKIINTKTQISKTLTQSQSMLQDINLCLEGIILNTQEQKFRPVMNAYNQQVSNFRSQLHELNGTKIDQIKVRKLQFKDIEQTITFFQEALKVQWQDNSQEYHTDNQEMEKFSKQSQPQNPVQCLQNQEKFIKSSLKDLGGLFCSFDE